MVAHGEEQPGDATSECWRPHCFAPSCHASHATDPSRESQAALVSDREHFRYTFAGPSGVERAGICVLTRTKAEPALARLNVGELQTRLLASPEYGFDRYSDTITESVQQLAENGGWALDLGRRPDAAIPFLYEMFDEIDRKSAED